MLDGAAEAGKRLAAACPCAQRARLHPRCSVGNRVWNPETTCKWVPPPQPKWPGWSSAPPNLQRCGQGETPVGQPLALWGGLSLRIEIRPSAPRVHSLRLRGEGASETVVAGVGLEGDRLAVPLPRCEPMGGRGRKRRERPDPLAPQSQRLAALRQQETRMGSRGHRFVYNLGSPQRQRSIGADGCVVAAYCATIR